MKIRKISLKNHPILGNLDLDFTKPDGSVHNTIIFVGENGCGKTTILKWISDLKKLHHVNKKIDYEFCLECITHWEHKVCAYPKPGVIHKMWNTTAKPKEFDCEPATDSVGNKIRIPFHSVYCQGASGIYPDQISTITTKRERDDDIYEQDKNLATFVKQLIINSDSEDADDILNWVRANPDTIPPTDIIEPRIKKIKRFIDPIFDNIQYKKIITHEKVVNGFNTVVKDVVFVKNDKEIMLDDMASGEKQVIFRTIALLHNMRGYHYPYISTEANISIDEPEISIHPKWQSKIFETYKNIAKSSDSQLFMATHSEHIIKNAIDSGDLIIILKESNDGSIYAKKMDDLELASKKNIFKPTYAQIIYEAFGIPTGEFHNELYQYIIDESGKLIFDNMSTKDFPHNKERILSDGSIWQNRKISMPTYIRHQYNHPNSYNSYSEQDLIDSIESMKNAIKLKKI